jgi:hypothetical protein
LARVSLQMAILERCTVEFLGLLDKRRKRGFWIRLTSDRVDSLA